MQNPNPNHKALTRVLIILGAFAIVPGLFYWLSIRPQMQRMQRFQQQVSTAEMGQPHSYFRVTPALAAEQAIIPEFQRRFLAKVPVVTDTEELIRYGMVLADALTSEAAGLGLRVSSVEALNDLVKGQYAPARNSSSNELARWPRLAPSRTSEPLRILLLDMPSLELQITMTGDYSKVFSFIESLVDFPAFVNVDGVSIENEGAKVSFRVKIRGYYSSMGKEKVDSSLSKGEARKL
jgi:Tfp pilus assembly protein PilO